MKTTEAQSEKFYCANLNALERGYAVYRNGRDFADGFESVREAAEWVDDFCRRNVIDSYVWEAAGTAVVVVKGEVVRQLS